MEINNDNIPEIRYKPRGLRTPVHITPAFKKFCDDNGLTSVLHDNIHTYPSIESMTKAVIQYINDNKISKENGYDDATLNALNGGKKLERYHIIPTMIRSHVVSSIPTLEEVENSEKEIKNMADKGDMNDKTAIEIDLSPAEMGKTGFSNPVVISDEFLAFCTSNGLSDIIRHPSLATMNQALLMYVVLKGLKVEKNQATGKNEYNDPELIKLNKGLVVDKYGLMKISSKHVTRISKYVVLATNSKLGRLNNVDEAGNLCNLEDSLLKVKTDFWESSRVQDFLQRLINEHYPRSGAPSWLTDYQTFQNYMANELFKELWGELESQYPNCPDWFQCCEFKYAYVSRSIDSRNARDVDHMIDLPEEIFEVYDNLKKGIVSDP